MNIADEVIDNDFDTDGDNIENSNDNLDDEDYGSYFADLYTEVNCNQEDFSQNDKENLTMKAMLNEIMYLQEELTKLKEIKPVWEKRKEQNEITDDMADFRIMKNGVSINASIVDEETFVAGDTLYKWGEMLYLEE